MRWLLLLLVAGCSDPDPTFELRDGERLKLRYWNYEDGTRQWDPASYFDAELKADCTPRRWSDGHTYCTPESGIVAYTDRKCSSPVGIVADNVEPPPVFRREFLFEAEQLPSRLYARGSARLVPEEVWFYQANECVGPLTPANGRAFTVEETSAVRLKTTSPRGDGRFRASIITTDDGMQAPARLYDSLVDVECDPARAEDGSTNCTPAETVDAIYFRDASCSVPMLSVRDDKPVPTTARLTDDVGCSSYYRVGAEVTSYPLYYRVGTDCLAIELGDHERVFEVGEPLVAPLEPRPAAAGARLQAFDLVDGDVQFPAPALFDSELGELCERVRISDFALCIPRMITLAPKAYYREPTCAAFEYGMPVPRRACEPPPVLVRADYKSMIRIYELAPPSTEPLYEQDGAGACAAVTRTDIRMVGPQIQLGRFVAAVHE